MKIIPVILAFAMSSLSACKEEGERTAETRFSAGAPAAHTSAEEKESEDDKDMDKLRVTIGNKIFYAEFEDGEAAKAFKGMLPLTLDMSELNGNEKYCYLDGSLPAEPEVPDRINAGDIMLYGQSCAVVFYKTFSTSYSYTPIGHIEDTDGLAEALGEGGVKVTFEAG